MAPKSVALSTLVLDYSLYPRHTVGSVRVAQLTEAARAGVIFPKPIVDEVSLRVVDGFGRITALGRVFGPDHKVTPEWRHYESDTDLWLDAVALNSAHGTRLTPFDIRRITILSEKMGVKPERLSTVLHVRPDVLRKTLAGRTNGERIPLKRTLAHLDGKRMTQPQIDANERASGMSALFHVRQLAMLIEADALDINDETLMTELAALADQITAYAGAAV